MNVEFLPQARDEVSEAFHYYENSQRGVGAEFLESLDQAIREIRDGPRSWTPIGRGHRQHKMRRFPYGVIYHLERDLVVVVAVMHLKRRPGYWKNRA